jgi:hypothetical protein
MRGRKHPLRYRRFLRFSTRSFLVLLTLAAILIGFRANQARRQHRIVQNVHKRGGQIAYDYQFDSAGNAITNAELPWPSWLRSLAGDDFFIDVTHIMLPQNIDTITPTEFAAFVDDAEQLRSSDTCTSGREASRWSGSLVNDLLDSKP